MRSEETERSSSAMLKAAFDTLVPRIRSLERIFWTSTPHVPEHWRVEAARALIQQAMISLETVPWIVRNSLVANSEPNTFSKSRDLCPKAVNDDALEERLVHYAARDIRSICVSVTAKPRHRHGDDRHVDTRDPPGDVNSNAVASTDELLMQQIFRDNRRWHEAERLLDPLRVAVAESTPLPSMTEVAFLEGQKVLAQEVYQRTMALPSGQGAMMFGTYTPVLTERVHTTGFNTGCTMQPSGNVVSAEKSHFTEEKVSWAFFHAGVNAGLRISRQTTIIDNSWIVLNKPNELGNRHAGLLLALGLNGHLKHMAKWLAFKYLTPKHNMTSIGLLLGLTASNLGTMDSSVTRLLSVHVTRLLPPGAAELNLTPLTQIAGIMGVGLLYYNSRHRRMTEILLSEIEYLDVEDNLEHHQTYRDEGYRLAAGFAVGFINLGKGRDVRLLHDLKATERLLAVATAPKEVDTVHILDQASAGATVALALIYLKSNNGTIASKIQIPSSSKQFGFIRPDILLLRTVARHLIMWDNIGKDFAWIRANLPQQFRGGPRMSTKAIFQAAMLPDAPSAGSLAFYNITAGLCWSIALKHAGTGDETAWKSLSFYFDHIRPVINTPYATFDKSLARDALMRFQHLLALGMATIMAGTGHLATLQRLRSLHGVVEDKTFGYHQAAHIAIGVLFLGRGRFTFGTNDLAIASLLCAFYPIFPKDALDNKAHLQAFRHFWVFAAEPRCLFLRDAETHEMLLAPVRAILRDGSERIFMAPGLLPELSNLVEVHVIVTGYWPTFIQPTGDARRLNSFKEVLNIFLRRKSLVDTYPSALAATFVALPRPSLIDGLQPMAWIFSLAPFQDKHLHQGDFDAILPHHADDLEQHTSSTRQLQTLIDMKTTAVDDFFMLYQSLTRKDDSQVMGDIHGILLMAANMAYGAQADSRQGVLSMREEWLKALRATFVELRFIGGHRGQTVEDTNDMMIA